VAGEESSELVDWKRRSLVWLDGFVALVAAICGALTASNWLVVDGKVVRGYDLSAGVGVAAVASVGVVLYLPGRSRRPYQPRRPSRRSSASSFRSASGTRSDRSEGWRLAQGK
jgi:hypothetical protein